MSNTCLPMKEFVKPVEIHKKAMGTACYSLDHAKRCAAEGDSLLLLGGDTSYLAAESRRWIESVRQ